jgi:hypothetical protein
MIAISLAAGPRFPLLLFPPPAAPAFADNRRVSRIPSSQAASMRSPISGYSLDRKYLRSFGSVSAKQYINGGWLLDCSTVQA